MNLNQIPEPTKNGQPRKKNLSPIIKRNKESLLFLAATEKSNRRKNYLIPGT